MTMDPSQPIAPVPTVAAPGAAPDPTSAAAAPVAPTAPVAPVVAVAPRAKSGGVLNLLLIGAAILAIGGVAFAVGRSTAFPGVGGLAGGPIERGSFTPGAGGPGGFASEGGLAIDGTVTAVDADSITLTLKNGDEMTFATDGDTMYHEATDAAATDVAVGDDVSVKVDGGGRIQSGNGGSTDPDLSAGDVTVAR